MVSINAELDFHLDLFVLSKDNDASFTIIPALYWCSFKIFI